VESAERSTAASANGQYALFTLRARSSPTKASIHGAHALALLPHTRARVVKSVENKAPSVCLWHLVGAPSVQSLGTAHPWSLNEMWHCGVALWDGVYRVKIESLRIDLDKLQSIYDVIDKRPLYYISCWINYNASLMLFLGIASTTLLLAIAL
jgi:hypothetical protein